MSPRLRIVLGIVVAVQCLIPPWQFTLNTANVRRSEPAGYHLIVDPPARRANQPSSTGVAIDLSRLMIQLAATAALAVVAVAMSSGSSLAVAPKLSVRYLCPSRGEYEEVVEPNHPLRPQLTAAADATGTAHAIVTYVKGERQIAVVTPEQWRQAKALTAPPAG